MLKVIRREGLSREEYALASFLQGGINKKHPHSLLVDVDIYLSYVKEPWAYIELWEAAELWKQEFAGLAVYDLQADDVSINLAATACAAEDYLGVPRALLDRFLDMPVLFDAADYTGSRAWRQEQVFDRYKEKLNPAGLVHQVVLGADFRLELRDYAIFKGYLTFFTDEIPEDLAFREKVFAWADRNIAVYGWTADEIAFLKSVSSYGNYVVPMDWSANHSYFSGETYCKQQLRQKNRTAEPLTPGKHYMAIVVSDGDNVQWLERDFATTSTYGQRLGSPAEYKVNWTISPSMTSLCPDLMQGLYDKARSDSFISGVSGIGYTNLMTYPESHLSAFARLTAEAMEEADLSCLCMLDNVDTLADMDSTRRRLDILAAYEQIRGGIWELDPDRYSSGSGRVLFSSNGKPFVSVRFSLWHPSNRPGQVTREWLEEYIRQINALPVSPNTIDGYTVLNVHPWTMEGKDLDYLVSRLAPHIELVYVRDMLDAIRENVPHEDACPAQ